MIRETWDYLMRRKPLLGLLLAVLALGGVLGAKIMMAHQPVVSQAQEIGVGSKPTYNNSLTLQVLGQSGKSGYELAFSSDFRLAKIKVSTETLAATASVRILDRSGQMVASETATLQNGNYQFRDTPVNYNVALAPGYIIEVQAIAARMLSNLDYSLATAFDPSNGVERYVVTLNGLRKYTWTEAEGEDALYNLLKNYITGQIKSYQSNISDAVLNNKNLDTARKTQIILAFRELRGVDQEPYREFINHLRRGGVPQITYSGKRRYDMGETVDFTKLVSARDGEDGEYSPEQIITQSEVDLNRAGEYTLSYIVSDSDRNKVTLRIPIVVAETTVEPEPIPDDKSDPEQLEDTTQSVVNGDVPTLGGGINSDNSLSELEPTTTIWDEHDKLETDLTPDTSEEPTTTVQPGDVNASSADEEKPSAGIGASQIVLIVLGIVLLIGLVRFIFDHYVR